MKQFWLCGLLQTIATGILIFMETNCISDKTLRPLNSSSFDWTHKGGKALFFGIEVFMDLKTNLSVSWDRIHAKLPLKRLLNV